MSQVKLNPYVDLGLSSDPNAPAMQDNQQTTVTNPLPDPGLATTSPSFGGITDLSSLSAGSSTVAPANDSVAPTTSTPNLYTQVNTTDLKTDSGDQIKVVSSEAPETSGSNSLILVFALIFFLASIGALVFFALKYFQVI